jgi:16S rRNA (adenine1518-N6/adenine1519-N6)-dimethyltransferase
VIPAREESGGPAGLGALPSPEHWKLPPWSEVRAELEALGFRPSRRLGQNLLVDANMARAIVRDARVAAGDCVLEVGAGAGCLTLLLAQLGVRLVVVEIDGRLAELTSRYLERFAHGASVEWLVADALASKHRLNRELEARLPRDRPWHVVSNLPYSAGTPILVLLARLAHPPSTLTVLLQRELALRILAEPGGTDWGPLAIRLQTLYAARAVRTVAPQLFWPRPKVESVLLRLERRSSPGGQVPDPRELMGRLDPLLEGLFGHRRQSLGRAFARLLGDPGSAAALLARHGLDPRLRPQQLGRAELERLALDPALGGLGRGRPD